MCVKQSNSAVLARDSASPIARGWNGLGHLSLGPGWGIGSDANQWVLLRRRNYRSSVKWQPVAFIGSNTGVLMRVIHEAGVVPSPEALNALGNLPERFLDWRDGVTG